MDTVLIGEILSLMMFLGIIGVLLLGFPVAFTLPGVALIFALIGTWLGAFDPSNLSSIAPRYMGIMLNDVLVAVPLFIFMGMMLERSGIAEQLLVTMGRLFGTLRGGLGISVIAVGALLAASTGIVGATVVTMGLLALPSMLRAGYDPKLASGVICASGTLGQIIPPSTVLIFMGDMLGGMNAQVQMELGNFAPKVVSVGNLFAGAFIPGLILVATYMCYVMFKAVTDPESCPALTVTAEERAGLMRDVIVTMIPTLALIVAVLGSILAGIATPTESASVGAVGAMAARRDPGAVHLGEPAVGDGIDRHDHVDDLHHPDRSVGFWPRFPDAWRRRSGRRVHGGASGRKIRRDRLRDASDVRAGVHPRHVRDHLHHHSGDRAGAAC